MNSGTGIGRVGGLAVALGIGIAAAATPGVAWADDVGSADPAGDAGGSAAVARKHEARAATSKAGGAHTPRTSTDDGPAADDDATEPATRRRVTRRSVPDLTAADRRTTPAKSGGSGARRLGDEPARVRRSTADTTVDPVDVNPSPPEFAAPAAAEVVDPPVTAVATVPADVVAHVVSVAPAPPPPAPVQDMLLKVPAVSDLDPSAADGPLAPAYSPLAMALAAWGTRSREADRSQAAGLMATNQIVATASVANAAPPQLGVANSIAVGTNPSGIVVSPDGRIYIANAGSRSVSVLTAIGERIDANPSWFSKDLSVGSAPGALALNADGTRLYVANAGSGTVSVIDTFTYKRIDANPSWFSKDIAVGSSPSALSFGSDGRLYVANAGSNSVSVIDTSNNKLIDTNSNTAGVQSISVGAVPNALALDAAGRLYVANRGSNTVSVINTGNYSVINTLAVGSQPAALALGAAGRLYVANAGSGTVSVIDTATNTVGASPIPVGPAPTSIAVSPDGKFAYVANGNDSVSVIDTATSAVVGTVAFDSDASGGHAVAVTPAGTVYVTDAADRVVRVLAPPSAAATRVTEIGNVAVTGYPVGAVLSGDGSRALIVTGPDPLQFTGSTRLAVVNTATGAQVGATITLAGKPTAPVLSADGRRATVTVTNAGATQAVVIDLATGTQVTSPLVGLTAGAAGNRSVTTTVDGGSIHVAVIDTGTGNQVGTTVTLTGSLGLTAYSTDGNRVVVTAIDAGSTHVAAINLDTGTLPGVIFTLPGVWDIPLVGQNYTAPLLTADGSRALLSSAVTDPVTGTPSTRIAVVNTLTGAQTGTTLTLPGEQFGSRLVSLDGSRALIVTSVYDGRTSTNNLRLAVIDTTTGAQTGATTTLIGFLNGGVLYSADTTRAVVTAISSNFNTTGVATTQVAVIDTSAGNQVGATLTLTPDNGLTVLSANGVRALVNTSAQTVVLNTVNGSQAGTLAGARAFPLLTPDGSRAVTATIDYNWFTRAYTTHLSVAQIV